MARAALLVVDPGTFLLASGSRGNHNAVKDIPAFHSGFRGLTVVVRAWLREQHTVAPEHGSSRARVAPDKKGTLFGASVRLSKLVVRSVAR
jgi:hypothetical protein